MNSFRAMPSNIFINLENSIRGVFDAEYFASKREAIRHMCLRLADTELPYVNISIARCVSPFPVSNIKLLPEKDFGLLSETKERKQLVEYAAANLDTPHLTLFANLYWRDERGECKVIPQVGLCTYRNVSYAYANYTSSSLELEFVYHRTVRHLVGMVRRGLGKRRFNGEKFHAFYSLIDSLNPLQDQQEP